MSALNPPPAKVPTSSWALLWASTKTAMTPFGIALAIIGLVVVFTPKDWPAGFGLALLVLMTFFAMVLFCCLLEVRPHLIPARPIADQGMPPHDPYPDSKAVIITSRCSNLHHGAPVTLEVRQSGYEREIGYGSIVKIQSDGKAVLAVDRWCGGLDPQIIEGILQNRKDTISRLIVRPDFRQYIAKQSGPSVTPSQDKDACA